MKRRKKILPPVISVEELKAKIAKEEKRLREIKRSLRIMNRLRRDIEARKKDLQKHIDIKKTWGSWRPDSQFAKQESIYCTKGIDLFLAITGLKSSRKRQVDALETLHRKLKRAEKAASDKISLAVIENELKNANTESIATINNNSAIERSNGAS